MSLKNMDLKDRREAFFEKYECYPSQFGEICGKEVLDDFTALSVKFEEEFGPTIAKEFFDAALRASREGLYDSDPNLNKRIEEEAGEVISSSIDIDGNSSNPNYSDKSFLRGLRSGLKAVVNYDPSVKATTIYGEGFGEGLRIKDEENIKASRR